MRLVTGREEVLAALAEIARRRLRTADLLTDPQTAQRFVRETGVDLIVPSLGARVCGVGADGVCKVNYYTAMARSASGAVRAAWDRCGAGPLPVEMAAGSFIHGTRRRLFRDAALSMLDLLHGDVHDSAG